MVHAGQASQLSARERPWKAFVAFAAVGAKDLRMDAGWLLFILVPESSAPFVGNDLAGRPAEVALVRCLRSILCRYDGEYEDYWSLSTAGGGWVGGRWGRSGGWKRFDLVENESSPRHFNAAEMLDLRKPSARDWGRARGSEDLGVGTARGTRPPTPWQSRQDGGGSLPHMTSRVSHF